MVTHSATVNHGGGLRKDRERVFANPCHYAQAMFAAFADAVPVKIELRSQTQTAPLVLPDLKNVTSNCSYKTIDALAAKSQDGNLLISLVHRGTSGPIDLEIVIKDSDITSRAELQTLWADVPWAVNALETPEAITPVSTTAKIENGKMLITIKPYTVLKITASKAL
jgi:alpha-N-arabinofuranosidase